MDPIQDKLEEHSRKLDEIYTSVEKTRKYFLWTLIANVAFFVLPLVVFLFILPTILSTLTGGLL